MPDWFAFFTSVSNQTRALYAWVITLFNALITALQAVLQFLWNALVAVVNFFGRLALHTARFFRDVWDKFLKRGLLKLVEWYRNLKAWLQRVFGPVLRWLRKIRDWLDRHYYPRLLKLLNMLQRVRMMLGILRIFNVEWAKKLDARILRLEQKIAEPYLKLRALLNDVANIINIVLDPAIIFRRNVLLASVLAHLPWLRRVLEYGRARELTSAEQVRQEAARTRYNSDNVRARIAARVESGLTQDDKQRMAEFRLALARVSEA